jgi:hypothetical protein
MLWEYFPQREQHFGFAGRSISVPPHTYLYKLAAGWLGIAAGRRT